MLNFNRFEKDLKKAYLQAINNSVESFNNYGYQQLNDLLSPLLFEMINSYYFKDQYKECLMVKKDAETYSDMDLPIYVIKEQENYYNGFALFYDGINQYTDKKSSLTINIPIVPIESIKEKLKEISPLYSIIFETDSLRRNLNLLNKNDLKFQWIYVTDDLDKQLKNIHKIEEDLDTKYLSTNKLKDNLNSNYGLEYVNFDSNRNRYFLVAHNEYEIAAIASVPNDSSYSEFKFKDNFKYLSYIAVSKAFRGNSLGATIFEKILEKADEENWIIIRSSPSQDGRKHLEKKIDKIAQDNNSVLIINHDVEHFFTQINQHFNEIKKIEDFKNKSKLCIPLVKNVTSIFSEYGNHLEAIYSKEGMDSDDFQKINILTEKRTQEVNLQISDANNILNPKNKKVIKCTPK